MAVDSTIAEVRAENAADVVQAAQVVDAGQGDGFDIENEQDIKPCPVFNR